MRQISSISDALKYGKKRLKSKKVNEYELSAELLLSDVSKLSRQQLYSHFDDELSQDQIDTYFDYINRRCKHEPVQYILGYTYFRDLKFFVGPGVLIPRPETEMLVEYVVKRINKQKIKILDLCTGSGCIACSLAKEHKESQIIATDISNNALFYAKKNVETNSLSEQIELCSTNFADDVKDSNFDIIVSNPPYVPEDVYKSLDFEVVNYEPKISLWAGSDSLYFLNNIFGVVKNKLNDDGFALVELHENSLDDAAKMAQGANFSNVEILKDLNNLNRFLYFKK